MPLEFKQQRLDNGLTVVAECNDDAHTSAVGFFVKTGARDEDRADMGVSHFLEHMMFKATLRGRTGDDVNREFDEIGANYNAFTSHEATVYYAGVLPEFLPRAIDLLGDMLRPALRDEDFNMERNVILEEIGMYDDRPTWRLQDALLEQYFGGHPLAFRVLGTKDTIGSMTPAQMRGYFEHRYSPDNITVAAAGRIEFQKLVELIANVAGDWQPTGARRDHGRVQPVFTEQTLADPKVTRHYLGIMSPAPSAQDPRRYAAKVLADALGDEEGSRLYWALVDPGLADEADFSFLGQDASGAFMAYASCSPDRAAQVEEVLTQTLDRFAASIEPEELERVKNKLATQATLEGENPRGRMRGVGMQWTYQGEYQPLAAELQKIMAVTPDDIRSLCEAMPFAPRSIVRLGPAAASATEPAGGKL